MLSCAMWLGLRQRGKQGSTSGQDMSMALAQMIYLKPSTAQMEPLSITTWALRTLFLSLPSPTQPVIWETTHPSLSLLCSPLNFSPTISPAIQVCVATLEKRRALQFPSPRPPACQARTGKWKNTGHSQPSHHSKRLGSDTAICGYHPKPSGECDLCCRFFLWGCCGPLDMAPPSALNSDHLCTRSSALFFLTLS